MQGGSHKTGKDSRQWPVLVVGSSTLNFHPVSTARLQPGLSKQLLERKVSEEYELKY